YALAQGFFVGAISKMYESFQGGIVVQAIGATLAVFLVMLFLYGFRIIKVTDKFRRTVIFATLGIMVFYGVSFIISLFAGAGSVSFLSSSTPLSIGFSVIVAGIAAMNLALDFDFIERGEKMGLDRDFEWYGAFGLLVTIIWLYLELLRLLSKLRN
ncbi:MAG: Bax inhibitor-1/YccA family protein, partial [Candidatus Microthrix parvicella]